MKYLALLVWYLLMGSLLVLLALLRWLNRSPGAPEPVPEPI